MARKPETQFIASVHSYLPPELHREKMANPYRGGTWDNWYDGAHADLWVEYKWAETLPPVLDLTKQSAKPCLSTLQLRWGEQRYQNGRNIAVILGVRGEGALIFRNMTWEHKWHRNLLQSRFLSRKETAQFIQRETLTPRLPDELRLILSAP